MDLDRLDPGVPAVIAAALAESFAERHGRPPVGVFAAPGRVNLMGEHTDYNAGLCLPIALPHATYAAAAAGVEGRLTVTSRGETVEVDLDQVAAGDDLGWAAYVVGVVHGLRELGAAPPGLDVVLDSTVPLGSGLSSSAALECSVALATCAVAATEGGRDATTRRELDRRRLVEVCMRAEAEFAGAPTGGMDQTASLFARPGQALRLDCADWTWRHLDWDPGAADVDLLVIDTRASHSLADGAYGRRRAECEASAAALGVGSLREVTDLQGALGALEDEVLRRRTRHVVTEIARVDDACRAIESGDLAALGQVFDASHRSLRDDFEVSSPELDVVVDTARSHGALGARMTGGGFGGSAIALVPTGDVPRVESGVAAAFRSRGWRPPGVLVATPSVDAGPVPV